jgi:hypothetical protein
MKPISLFSVVLFLLFIHTSAYADFLTLREAGIRLSNAAPHSMWVSGCSSAKLIGSVYYFDWLNYCPDPSNYPGSGCDTFVSYAVSGVTGVVTQVEPPARQCVGRIPNEQHR